MRGRVGEVVRVAKRGKPARVGDVGRDGGLTRPNGRRLWRRGGRAGRKEGRRARERHRGREATAVRRRVGATNSPRERDVLTRRSRSKAARARREETSRREEGRGGVVRRGRRRRGAMVVSNEAEERGPESWNPRRDAAQLNTLYSLYSIHYKISCVSHPFRSISAWQILLFLLLPLSPYLGSYAPLRLLLHALRLIRSTQTSKQTLSHIRKSANGPDQARAGPLSVPELLLPPT